MVSVVQKYNNQFNNIHDLAPTYMIITCAMYIVLKKIPIARFGEKFNRVIRFIGKHSFSVYMLHITVMSRVMRIIPFTDYYLLYLLLITVIVAVISLFIGTLFDNTVITLLEKAVSVISATMMKRRGKDKA